MTRHAGDLLVSGLSTGQTQSLAAALSVAAIAVESDPYCGTVLVRRGRNRVFDRTQIEDVIREWQLAEGHDAQLTLVACATGAAGATNRRQPLMKFAWPASTR